jgi:hypothetical protein
MYFSPDLTAVLSNQQELKLCQRRIINYHCVTLLGSDYSTNAVRFALLMLTGWGLRSSYIWPTLSLM